MNTIKNICLSTFIFLLISCKPDEVLEVNPSDSYQYFPIEVGDFKIFKKITNSYAVGQKVKIDTVLVKEIVKSVTVSNNDKNYLIERQIKGKNDLFYKPESVFQVITSPSQVILGERNVYTILLKYPVYVKAKWDLNEINGGDKLIIKVVPEALNPIKLPLEKDLLTVRIDSVVSEIGIDIVYNIFAKNKGLVYSKNDRVELCQTDACLASPNKIKESGKEESKQLIEMGKIEK